MNPIYLIIDTNIWLYMANGELQDETGKKIHINVFKILQELVYSGEIAIIVSPIIIDEFDRNKDWVLKYIKCLEGRVTEKRKFLKNHRKELSADEIKTVEKLITSYADEINFNRQHISEVESFLRTNTIIVPITESTKTKCFDQAIAKKAPFTGKKSNSTADMAILLSAIEYIDTRLSTKIFDELTLRPQSIFISGNISDFSQDKKENKDKVHPDLLPFLNAVDMGYSISLGTTLNSISDNKMSVEEIAEMDEYLPYDYIDCPNCAGWHDGMGVLDSHSIATLIDENIPKPMPKEQLTLPFEFPQEDEDLFKRMPQRITSIELFQCNWCNCQFFSCPVCGNLVMYDEESQCDNCEAKFECEDELDRKGLLIRQTVRMLKWE